MVICLERGADLHIAQLMPLPLTVSCFSKIQIGFTFLVPAQPGSPGQRAVKRMYVAVANFAVNRHFLITRYVMTVLITITVILHLDFESPASYDHDQYSCKRNIVRGHFESYETDTTTFSTFLASTVGEDGGNRRSFVYHNVTVSDYLQT